MNEFVFFDLGDKSESRMKVSSLALTIYYMSKTVLKYVTIPRSDEEIDEGFYFGIEDQ